MGKKIFTPKKGKKKQATIGITIIIIVGLVALSIALKTSNETWLAISLGTLSSLIASIIWFYIFQTFSTGEDDINDKLADINTLIENHVFNFKTEGVSMISTKDYPSNEFWFSILEDCSEEMWLIGHSLSQWFKTPYDEKFYEKLLELALKGKKVKVIMFLPIENSQCLITKEHIKYKNGVIYSLEHLYENVIENLDEKNKPNIMIKLAPYCSIHNMMIVTDNYLFCSPYNRHEDNHKNILFQLKKESPIALNFFNDCKRVFKSELSVCFSALNKGDVQKKIQELSLSQKQICSKQSTQAEINLPKKQLVNTNQNGRSRSKKRRKR